MENKKNELLKDENTPSFQFIKNSYKVFYYL